MRIKKSIVNYIKKNIIHCEKKSIINCIKESELFNENWYREIYNISDGVNVYEHYINIGAKQGYYPSEKYSTVRYLLDRPDVASSGMNPLYHYEMYGKNESVQIFTLDDDIKIIEGSLLFDKKWYKETYGLGEYVEFAKHYILYGWYLGYNPSKFFNNEDYLKTIEDKIQINVNPLLLFEYIGYEQDYYRDNIIKYRNEILSQNPEVESDMDGGIIRVRITNACNAKCRYCGVRLGYTLGDINEAMPSKWLYDYCAPLYDKVNIALITGGDPFIAKESYSYFKYLTEKYPSLNIYAESNGIAFDERYQNMAADNLFITHFSINASNSQIYEAGCWEGAGGDKAYNKFMFNINNYIKLLEKRNMLVFAPNLSMVINKDTYTDVLSFIKLSLELKSSFIILYFDYTENDMGGDCFLHPEYCRPVLKTLMEVERVLAGKVQIFFRLWIPLKESRIIQQEVEKESIITLNEKYTDLLELAKNRCVKEEYEERNNLRRKQGKKLLSMYEDLVPTVHFENRCGHEVCFAPWKEIDIYPDGRIDFCGWIKPMLNLKNYISNDKVEWDKILNSFEYMAARKRILNSNFTGCMNCCPMNTSNKTVESPFKYNYLRTNQNEG